MKKSELIKEVKDFSTDIAQKHGYEIVDVEFTKGGKHDLLSVLVYKEDGIDLNDCSIISREIEEILDERDLLKDPYYLEISSPGIDRPIKTVDDYRRNRGREVEVKTYSPIDGKKEFVGILTDYDEDCVTIVDNEDNIKLPIKSISHMVQTIKF